VQWHARFSGHKRPHPTSSSLYPLSMTLFLERDVDNSTPIKLNYFEWRRIVWIEGEKEIGDEHTNEKKRSNLRKVEMKLLTGNGRQAERTRDIERGTVVKTPCWLALQDSKYN
jgi:hypothetical protein